jgi:hypothetical protein
MIRMPCPENKILNIPEGTRRCCLKRGFCGCRINLSNLKTTCKKMQDFLRDDDIYIQQLEQTCHTLQEKLAEALRNQQQ